MTASSYSSFPSYNSISSYWDESSLSYYYTIPFSAWCGIQFRLIDNTSLYVRAIWGSTGWGNWFVLSK